MLNKFLHFIFKHEIYKLHKIYEKNQWLSKKDIENLQLLKLKELIKYSYETVPFYRNLWDKHGVDIDITNLDDLKKFPTIDKNMLQNAISNGEISQEFIDKLNTKKIVWQSTTGSSGTPFRFPVDLNSENHKNALRIRLYRWYGLEHGTKWVKFWRGNYKKSLKEKIKEFIAGRYTLCIYDPKFPKQTQLNDERIKYFIDELNKIKPKVIDGFVSALREIANYILKNNINLKFALKSVVTGAELLDENSRKIISKAFKAPVFNRYGGTESSIIAFECEYQTKNNHFLHIQQDRLIVETNENDEIIFTCLSTRSIPFIRYKNGDLGKIDKNYKCPCGCEFDVFTELSGRTNDMFVLPNGAKISSHMWQNYMKKCSGIEKYQMIQENLNLVTINYIKNEKLFNEKDFLHVKDLIQNALENCTINWVKVDNIDVGVGGKFRQHICKVNL